MSAEAAVRDRGSRRFPRRAVVLATAAVAAAAAGLYIFMTGTSNDSAAESSSPPPAATAEVVRRDLIETQSFEGLLGFAGESTLTSSATGTITWLPDEGSVARRGEALFRVDGRAVRLLYGNAPAYRTMSSGMSDGRDVLQLERNLVALGYDPDGDIEVDREFDSATRAAVQRWEEDLGLAEDGILELGEVVFLPGARRIGSHTLTTGAPAALGGEIMSTSSSSRIVELDVAVADAEFFSKGRRVDVTLPDGEVVSGRVSGVGTVAEVPTATEGGESDPTVPVEVTLGKADADALDRAPVDVEVAVDRVEDALSVPVSALLALAEGGYALEVVNGGSTSLVAVEPGKFADGWVEVSGDGIAEGAEVVVPE